MSGSSRAVGGRSLWGSTFDVILSKYGWTLDYLLWGISYVNVQMLLSDTIAFVDKENEIINADDPRNRDKIKAMLDE